MINSYASVSKMNTTELYEYVSQTLAHAQQQGPTLVVASPLYVQLSNLLTKYDEGFKKDGKSMLTSPIVTLDNNRDRIVKYAYYTTLALSFCTVSSKEEAANLLLSKFELYGGLGISKLAYSEESASIKSLLNDLRRPEYASAVALVGIQPILNELESVQAEFDAKLLERREEKDTRSSIDAAYSIRGNMEVALRQFRMQVSVNALTQPNSEWSRLDGILQQLDTEYTQRLRTKSTLRAKQKESDGQPQ